MLVKPLDVAEDSASGGGEGGAPGKGEGKGACRRGSLHAFHFDWSFAADLVSHSCELGAHSFDLADLVGICQRT